MPGRAMPLCTFIHKITTPHTSALIDLFWLGCRRTKFANARLGNFLSNAAAGAATLANVAQYSLGKGRAIARASLTTRRSNGICGARSDLGRIPGSPAALPSTMRRSRGDHGRLPSKPNSGTPDRAKQQASPPNGFRRMAAQSTWCSPVKIASPSEKELSCRGNESAGQPRVIYP